jgi:hypothetical protein
MSVAEWSIDGPLDFAWTPEEMAQIGRAAQAFQAALPTGGGFLDHTVRIDGLGIVDSTVKVDWPQPGDDLDVFGPVPCSICGLPVRVDKAHVHSRGETMTGSTLRSAQASRL